MKNRPRTKYFILETVERPVSKKEFVQHNEREFMKENVSRKNLLKNMTFTKSELGRYERKNVLVPVLYKRKKYYKKEDIIRALKNESPRKPPSLF